MAYFQQTNYLDPFAARNLATAESDTTDTRVAHLRFVPSPSKSTPAGNIQWWVERYEAAGRALIGAGLTIAG